VELRVVYEPDEKGCVHATVGELPGVVTCALRDALSEWLVR